MTAIESSPFKLNVVKQACELVNYDRSRLMDVLIYVQSHLRGIDYVTMEHIASHLNCHRVEIEGMVTFYSFFSIKQKGVITIRLCDDIVDQYYGVEEIAKFLTQELNIELGETTEDGQFSVEYTPCIGMCDQAPAALINGTVFTQLSIEKMRDILSGLKSGTLPEDISQTKGEGKNNSDLIRSMVKNNIRMQDKILFGYHVKNSGITAALKLSSSAVIDTIKASKLRGRGGAGFPTGLKWSGSEKVQSTQKYIICNADEGEPGTFKDRVLLTESPDLVFEGMTIAAYAIGASSGIIYLRGEYAYLRSYLEHILASRRSSGSLGKDVLGKVGFDFDIRIQLGAGAYICGEESSLISSCEGLRGEPKNRPPFPTESGYLNHPTVVNNVETLACAARIMSQGAQWFSSLGTDDSTGTKLISISGDCNKPGIYEIPFGISIREMLDLAQAEDTGAVVVGGPSGDIISEVEFQRKIAFEDLSTGGAIIVLGAKRNILKAVSYYMNFFVDESCGYCTPCRVGNVFLTKALEKIRKGQADLNDIHSIKSLCNNIILSSRCGLGKTSPNPILSTLKHFPMVYSALLKESDDGLEASFDIQSALEESRHLAKRRSLIYDPKYD